MTKYKNVVFLPNGGGYKKVNVDDIEYIEAQSYKSLLHLTDGSTREVSCPLCDVLKYFNPAQFPRIHRSYAVNINHIDTYYVGSVVMDSGSVINIGDNYRNIVKETLTILLPRDRKTKCSSQGNPFSGDIACMVAKVGNAL